MTDTAVAVRDEPTLTPFEVIERVITQGDLAKMAPEDRIAFYWRTCESLGLNPLTRPFEFIVLNGKMTMYARKDATDQLRRVNGVSVMKLRRERDDDLGLITVYAEVRDRSGRTDEASGIVSTKGLTGEALANAVMKAETKAKRRATLSLVGLGFLDESEVEDRGEVDVDPTTGAITERPKPKTLMESVQAQRIALAETETTVAPEPTPEVIVPDEAPAEAPDAPHTDEPPDAPSPDPVPDEPAPDAEPVAPAEPGELAERLTQDELLAALAKHRIAREYAAEVSRTMFPFRTSGGLTDEQRAELLAALLAP